MHKDVAYYHCTQYKGKHNAPWIREEEITEQIAKLFKNMKIPKDITKEIIETLDETHHEKIEFHNKTFDKLISEQKNLTKMLDNLYFDKLKGRITESDYDRFYQKLRDEMADVKIRLEQLQEAEDNYYATSKCILKLANSAYDLFMSSEVKEKQLLLRLLLSNLRFENDKLHYDVQKPFDLIIHSANCKLWRG